MHLEGSNIRPRFAQQWGRCLVKHPQACNTFFCFTKTNLQTPFSPECDWTQTIVAVWKGANWCVGLSVPPCTNSTGIICKSCSKCVENLLIPRERWDPAFHYCPELKLSLQCWSCLWDQYSGNIIVMLAFQRGNKWKTKKSYLWFHHLSDKKIYQTTAIQMQNGAIFWQGLSLNSQIRWKKQTNKIIMCFS